MIARIRQLSHVQTFSVLAVVVLLAAVGITVTISQQQQVARNQAATTSSGISTDTLSSKYADNVSSISWTQTVNSHLSQILIVTVSTSEHITSSVTYNGVNMVKVGNATCPSTCNASMWYLLNPPTGSHTVVANLSGSTSVVAGAATYYNVNQSSPLGAVATSGGKSNTAAVSVSSIQSQLIVDSYTNENHGGTPASGQTQVYENNTVNAGGSSYKDGAAGSTVMTWNGKSTTSENWAVLAVALNGLSTTQSTTSNTSVPVVNSLVLWNAQTNAAIKTLSNNSIVDLSTTGTTCLNIRAITTPSTVGSVVFAYDGNTHYNTENNLPYDLGGDQDTGNTPKCMSIGVGDHVLAATPYGSSDGSGTLGLPAIISFSVVAQTPTNTPVPVATNTPIPTATPAPTIGGLTVTPVPTSVNATNTPAPTIPAGPNDTLVGLTLFLHGLGKSGDNANPNGTGNTSPIHTQRTAVVQAYDSNNNLIATNQGTVSYDVSSGSFKGTVNLGSNVSTGAYTVKVKTNQYLRVLIPGIQTLAAAQTNQLPQASLIVGDINNDNQINILDYNILMGCYSDLLPPVSCAAGNDVLSDLNDDGHVNQFDYNLFLRELSNNAGQ